MSPIKPWLFVLCVVGFSFSFPHNIHNHHGRVRVVHVSSTQASASRLDDFRFPRGKREITNQNDRVEEADIVVVGGGVSGLAAAITAAEALKADNAQLKVVLLEGSSDLGGRVQSEITKEGFVLDKGFAVFIDQYPEPQRLLDLDALKLKPFLPGALVKLPFRNELARVSDPLRRPEEAISALVTPIGSLMDKLNLLPLIFNVRTKSIEELFEESETDTASALSTKWRFSEDFISTFFKPFLEGIFLAPLSEQSSRMFSFVFKMFNEGSANLPQGGMVAVPQQLKKRAEKAGVDIRTNMFVTSVVAEDEGILVTTKFEGLEQNLSAGSVIVATDGPAAHKLLSSINGFQFLNDLPEQPQRSVGCLYYSFKGPAPVNEPILILNGMTSDFVVEPPLYLVNNICFPSEVNRGYAPDGFSLCSVSVLGKGMEDYEEKHLELDLAVREELASWFPGSRVDILEQWKLEKIFHIRNAQPSQYRGPYPANVHEGRAPNKFRDTDLPAGLFVCGDHMATATLNGAFESGICAGRMATRAIYALRKKR
eukprot:scaffold2830_cov131-Cylindrotheca_fusiformis.AAC.69